MEQSERNAAMFVEQVNVDLLWYQTHLTVMFQVELHACTIWWPLNV